MILMALGLFLISIVMSAFFSGSETGFYRANRARIVMNAIQGKSLDRFVLFLTNHPAMMVATVLIGNNVANYLVSLSIVLLAQALLTDDSAWAEFAMPLMMTPFLFVYGESLPKAMFFQAPNRLLRLTAPFLAFFTILLSPAVIVLYGMARALEWLLGQSPERTRMSLGRREMEKVLEESQEIGLLHPAQRLLSQNFFLIAAKPVRSLVVPASRIPAVEQGRTIATFLAAGRKSPFGVALMVSQSSGQPVGYVRMVDLMLIRDKSQAVTDSRPLMTVPADETSGEALMQMQSRHHSVATVAGPGGGTIGYLFRDRMIRMLLRESDDSPRDSTSSGEPEGESVSGKSV